MNALTRAEVMEARAGPGVPTPRADNADVDVPRAPRPQVIPIRATGFTAPDPQGYPQTSPQVAPNAADPAGQLDGLWAELERQGAVVNRIPLDSHPDLIAAKVEHEARRIRALRERP